MSKNIEYEIEVINAGDFIVSLLHTEPPRLEAKVIFDREHISQKLIFTLMDITHTYGMGCSPPYFKGPDDSSMVFLICCITNSKRFLKKYLKRMENCLNEIKDFSYNFSQQLDFTKLDLSMFNKVNLEEFYPEHLSALKDQYYNGSWIKLKDAMVLEGRDYEARMVDCCVEFEKTNLKDIGFVGHKLGHMLQLLDQIPPTDNETN